jgi:hypothetical protein
MDIQTVERKVRSGLYETPEDFEFDMVLIFRNCEVYHGTKKNEHRVALGKFGAKQFRKLFTLRLRASDDPVVVQSPNEIRKDSKRMASPSSQNNPPVKKIKIENTTGGVSKGKGAPRISIAAAPISVPVENGGGQNTNRAKSPKTPSSTLLKKKSTDLPKVNQPVPLHVAIARVKEGFPLRRPLKDLQDWEKACARFLKELLRHSWISAQKPKFIFAVPVGDLFPVSQKDIGAELYVLLHLT